MPEVASGSGSFTCNLCLQPVSTNDALKRHQQTQSYAKRAASELAQGLSPALKKYSKLPMSLQNCLEKRSCYIWLQVSFTLLRN